MTKEKFDRSGTHVNAGAIGHVDHGRTMLTATITSVLAKSGTAWAQAYDQIGGAPEEKEHGVTINTAHVEYQTDKRRYAHVNCPDHVDHVKSMITDAAQMDDAILVVTASDGPTPQIREYILLARRVGVSYIVVFPNKYDTVDDKGLINLVEMEVREPLSEYGFDGDNTPVIRGSALEAPEGDDKYIGAIKELMDAVDESILNPTREANKPFLMSVEDVMTTIECGTVAIRRVERGVVKLGGGVEIAGIRDAQKTVATRLEMFHKQLDFIESGDNIGALLHDINRDQIQRGQVLTKPGSVHSHTKFKTQVYALTREEDGCHIPFASSYRLQFHFHTVDVTGAITLPEETKMVMPDDSVEMNVELIAPITIENNTEFSIREGGRTIGSSSITETIE